MSAPAVATAASGACPTTSATTMSAAAVATTATRTTLGKLNEAF